MGGGDGGIYLVFGRSEVLRRRVLKRGEGDRGIKGETRSASTVVDRGDVNHKNQQTKKSKSFIATFLGKFSFHFLGNAFFEQFTVIANFSILLVKRVLSFEH